MEYQQFDREELNISTLSEKFGDNAVSNVALLSGVKIKVKSKKTSKRTFRSHGYFDYLGRWVSGKTTHTTLKICKVNIKFKKAKNAYKYKIEKRPESGTTMNDSWITTKTNNNYEMWFKGGTGKVTVKITPYSKEGIKGKTIKKTIRI